MAAYLSLAQEPSVAPGWATKCLARALYSLPYATYTYV
ncbi:hypothetical protein J2W42_001779 [Rhizobium tibeticum]|uniref:Uncharacterized protein n=1 Tax=Rhizobium tibeticum TaxID=501024 RepID=A0A1H8LUV5_9HYPH|nr:hypothetical protein [Rhizobium tibeticum]SEH88983.1 hypothetical protein RTCCBAU85039_2890 [Rhizobium tibeticum]SEO08656.1 hypothetical protein SAMN05216228_1011151 [Rhizobium tibeticum]